MLIPQFRERVGYSSPSLERGLGAHPSVKREGWVLIPQFRERVGCSSLSLERGLGAHPPV